VLKKFRPLKTFLQKQEKQECSLFPGLFLIETQLFSGLEALLETRNKKISIEI
jgi:hypothetical protein